jgi:hypothetical protein
VIIVMWCMPSSFMAILGRSDCNRNYIR